MREDVLAAIANKDSDYDELLMAIQSLGEVKESPDFWNSIANNPDYKNFHRAYCAIQLFKRHVTDGMSLGSLSKLLWNPSWVNDEDITTVQELVGEIPLTWTFEDTVFALRIFPELTKLSGFAIYLRVSGKVDLSSFISSLRGQEVDEVTKNAIVLEVGFIEPYRPGH